MQDRSTGSLRIALITRSFWPRTGGAETFMGNMALGLRERGALPQIVTAQWSPSWPSVQDWHGVRITRIAQPRARWWGTYRYLRGLAKWLVKHRPELDLVYVSMLKHDALVAQRVCGGSTIPVVLRAEGGGAGGDARWQTRHWMGGWIRRSCQTADAIVAPSRQITSELLASGYRPAQIHAIANGVPIHTPRRAEGRASARRILASASDQWLGITECRWVVYVGRLAVEKGLLDLVAAWSRVAIRAPEARLVLVGEGPARAQLVEEIGQRGLSESILMPGVFLETRDLLAAADLFVLPSYDEGLSLALLEALEAEVPVVATDIPGNREVLLPAGARWLVPIAAPDKLANAMFDLLADPDTARDWGKTGRQIAETTYNMARNVDAHLEFFRSLVDRKRGP